MDKRDKSKGKDKRRQSGRSWRTTEDEDEEDKRYYDPDQKPEERRAVRRGLRELGKTLNDNKAEYLQPTSAGILNTFTKANTIFKSVKQTSDATLDSRLLVTAADLAYARVKNLSFGSGSAAGVDVDEFVGKVISFMRNSPDERRRRGIDDEEEDDDGRDRGDAYDWKYLGRMAAFKATRRPATSDFMLGPLAITKRARARTARQAGLRRNAAPVTRPIEVDAKQLANGAGAAAHESQNTTRMVLHVAKILDQYLTAQAVPSQDSDAEDPQGVNYFRFVLNPKSYGQTIENIFYVSFLVRDGRAALWEGEDGMPMLGISEQVEGIEEARERGVVKRQVITALDVGAWRELCSVLGINEGVIPHRSEEVGGMGEGGWYS
ncbi:Nse4 C-terminal-domain-containing protein [Kalaharituber pfeilii]|nr:Nse4 C-terminal-domain-containing protein [Kalaharituber pfeilii]